MIEYSVCVFLQQRALIYLLEKELSQMKKRNIQRNKHKVIIDSKLVFIIAVTPRTGKREDTYSPILNKHI